MGKLGVMNTEEAVELACPYTFARSGSGWQFCIGEKCMSWNKLTDCEEYEPSLISIPGKEDSKACKKCGSSEEAHDNNGFCRRLMLR